jgi:hypothetical protein
MSQDTVDTSVRHPLDRSGTFERALEAVANRQFENDSRRRRIATDLSRRIAAPHAQKVLDDSPAHLRLLSNEVVATDPSSYGEPRDGEPALAGIGNESHRPRETQPQHAAAGHATTGRSFDRFAQITPSPDLSRMIAAHAGIAERTTPSSPLQLMEPLIADGRHTIQSADISEPVATAADSISGRRSHYIAMLAAQLEQPSPRLMPFARAGAVTTPSAEPSALPQPTSAAETLASEQVFRAVGYRDRAQNPDPRSLQSGDHPARARARSLSDHFTFTTAFAELSTSGPVRSQTEALANERLLFADRLNERGQSPDARSLGPDDDDRRADRLLSNDQAPRSVGTGVDNVFAHDDWRKKSGDLYTNTNRGDDRRTDDRPSSDTGTNRSVQEDVAAAANDLERLRAAVKRTIDDLERVRGSVQASLPALPSNRGTFRIS